MYDYVIGLCDFLGKNRNQISDLLIEGCSGSGGRFDAGMMYYTLQIWCSDNTDTLDRLQIQYGTSFGYPISAVGSTCISSTESSDRKKYISAYQRSSGNGWNIWI